MSNPMERVIDYGAAGATAGAPFWVPFVSALNAGLTTVSLLLGIAFLVWRWHRSINRPDPN